MNKVILIGRLTRDPELRHTPNGAATCNITVAVDRMPDASGQRGADFVPVVVWNKQAENVVKYLAKGRLVAVDGRIQTRNYEDRDGKRVYVTEVIASNVQFLESRNSVSNNNNNGYNNNNDYNNGYSNNYGENTNSYQDNNNNSYGQPTAEPYNNNVVESVDLDNDPFASFGESIAVSDNDLPF